MNTSQNTAQITSITAFFSVCTLLTLCACNNPIDIKDHDLTLGMNQYLEQRGDLCLAKNSWPIDVTQREMQSSARNALQLPVMEKLGLVSSAITTADMRDEDGTHTMTVKRFSLTDTGKKYYLTKEMRSMRADGLLPRAGRTVAVLVADVPLPPVLTQPPRPPRSARDWMRSCPR